MGKFLSPLPTILGLSAVVLTGCTVMRYEASPLSPGHSAASFAGRRLDVVLIDEKLHIEHFGFYIVKCYEKIFRV